MRHLRAPIWDILHDNTDNLLKDDTSSPPAGASSPGARASAPGAGVPLPGTARAISLWGAPAVSPGVAPTLPAGVVPGARHHVTDSTRLDQNT